MLIKVLSFDLLFIWFLLVLVLVGVVVEDGVDEN